MMSPLRGTYADALLPCEGPHAVRRKMNAGAENRVTVQVSFYCLDKLTEPKPGPEQETRPDTAVNRLDVTTTLIRV